MIIGIIQVNGGLKSMIKSIIPNMFRNESNVSPSNQNLKLFKLQETYKIYDKNKKKQKTANQ